MREVYKYMNKFVLLFQGIILGIAAVLPGLSTSVAAVLMGIYNELIDLMDNIRNDVKGSIKKLLPMGGGAVIGIMLSVSIVLKVCDKFPTQSYIFFAGLVIGGFPVVIKKINMKPFKIQYLLITSILFGIMYIVSCLNQTSDSSFVAITYIDSAKTFLTMMFAGVFSVSLMAIPGVSGSIMLMIIGQYGTVYNTAYQGVEMLSSLLRGDMTAFKQSMMSVMLLLPFIIGAIIGVAVIVKLLNFLIKNYEFAVYYGVAGILVSSVYTLINSAFLNFYRAGNTVEENASFIFINIAILLCGILCTIFLDKPSSKAK